MGCECNQNKCTAACGDTQGKECQSAADCGSKNNYTIQEFNDMIYSKKYIINYSNNQFQLGGSKSFKEAEEDVSLWSDPKLDGDHPSAKKVYLDLVHEFGKPNILINKEGGLAVWNEKQLNDGIHSEIILRDEAVKHCVPANHYDFLTSYINIYLPTDKFLDVMSVSGSVAYDGLKKLLSARCGSIAANLATLKTCLSIMDGKEEDYKNNIMQKGESMDKNREFIRKFIKKNNKQYSKELKEPYYALAFPNGCP
ncbi:hypothetical protein CPAV1605_346 [seawater metagenome]|uniref:Uncharacterized protein n=1 Tax=seawater metagenome TaxID=1561972 RepID=A0A5E8CHD5_9ZZZZ